MTRAGCCHEDISLRSRYRWDDRRRIDGIQALGDETTKRVLSHVGVTAGWHCIEAGAGGGSIAAWLGEQVTPGGHVIATDIDVRYLQSTAAPNVEIWEHDLTTDWLPDGFWNLVHARAVAEHLPDPEDAIVRLIKCLEPGGYLVIETADWTSTLNGFTTSPDAVRVLSAALDSLTSTTNYDREFAARLPSILHRTLIATHTQLTGSSITGGTGEADLFALTIERLRPAILSAELATDDEINAALADFASPSFSMLAPHSGLMLGLSRVTRFGRATAPVRDAIPAGRGWGS